MVCDNANACPAGVEQPGDLLDKRVDLRIDLGGQPDPEFVADLVEVPGFEPSARRAGLAWPDFVAQ